MLGLAFVIILTVVFGFSWTLSISILDGSASGNWTCFFGALFDLDNIIPLNGVVDFSVSSSSPSSSPSPSSPSSSSSPSCSSISFLSLLSDNFSMIFSVIRFSIDSSCSVCSVWDFGVDPTDDPKSISPEADFGVDPTDDPKSISPEADFGVDPTDEPKSISPEADFGVDPTDDPKSISPEADFGVDPTDEPKSISPEADFGVDPTDDPSSISLSIPPSWSSSLKSSSLETPSSLSSKNVFCKSSS